MDSGPTPSYNLGARFFEAARIYADQPALGIAGDDSCLTYQRLGEKVLETAVFLGRLHSGEPVGILSENRPEWCQVYLAIVTGGGMVVPVDALLKTEELTRVFDDSGFSKVFVSPKYLDVARKVAGEIARPIEIINIEAIPDRAKGEFAPAFAADPDSPAVMIFTSGTTGRPKKVILTHRNIISNIEGVIRRLPFGPGDRFLSVLPLHHTFEATCGFLTPLLHGCCVHYVKTINSREIMEGVKKHRTTHFIAVPLLYEKLYHGIINAVKKAPLARRVTIQVLMAFTRFVYSATGISLGKKLFRSLREKAGLGSIRLMVSGGAPLPMEVSRNFALMGFDFVEGYGMTETSPVISVNPPEKIKFGSVGPPLENIRVKIDEPNENGIGEVLVQGPSITPGYLGNLDATAELIRNGWLHTGDMGRLDKDGYLYIRGRRKNVIVSAAGKNIYPEEIEAALMVSPLVMEAMVWGKKAESGREEVAAMIYPDFDALSQRLGRERDGIGEDEIKNMLDPEVKAVCDRMADYKRVKHVVYLRQELEKTSSKKIKRFIYHNGDHKEHPALDQRELRHPRHHE